ncbi:MAG TPA: zinc ABC transporter substrate-binding protein [Gemmataceae bacterium]|nr:zinc ABC transporter substrate-binding protein [Gemmataceae bacterium]
MRKSAFILSLALLAGVGCRKTEGQLPRPDLSSRSAKILTTTGMIADAAKAVGGEHVQVDCLMGPGVDPHKYVPTPNDLNRIQGADLVLYNGLHLEGKMTDIFDARSKVAWTAAVAEGLPNLRSAEEGFEGTHDPHVWFDVTLWMKVVERIRDTLADLDPAHADQYRANASAYLERLAGLDREVRDKVARLPKPKRVLITAHDAFGYFGRAYDFEVLGLQGVSTTSEAGSPDVQALANTIGSREIRAVFAETSVSNKGMLAVLQAVRAKYKGFEPKVADAELYSDALGPAGSPGETYIGMVRHNVDTIVRALAD